MIDGKAKQFDDGLYAAIDQTYFQGFEDRLRGHVDLVSRIYEKVGPDGLGAAFLAAGLKVVGREVPVTEQGARDLWVQRFVQNPVASRPISFYTWNETLQNCWRFMRFFQTELYGSNLAAANQIAAALQSDPELLREYKQVNDFYARLTNPLSCLSFADIVDSLPMTDERLAELAKRRGVDRAAVTLFPPRRRVKPCCLKSCLAIGCRKMLT
jgi:hypothetical protein